MRSSIADYEVVEVLAAAGEGAARYLCRPAARLGWEDPVEVREVSLGDDRWPVWSDLVTRIAAVQAPDLRALLEIGLDPDGAGAWLSAEAAPGGDLSDPVGGRPVLLEAVASAARAVHALHEVGLAHGSVSPLAVVFTSHGPVLDPPVGTGPEGLVAAASGGRPLSAVDPELLRGEAPSRSSDIWSLGATLHLALSDRPLHPGIDSDQTVTAAQRVMFTRPEIDPALPAGVRQLIERCLAANPADRPETAADVSEALAGLAAER